MSRFGLVRTNEDGRIIDFDEKPMVATSHTVSCGIYVIRRRQLIELIEKCAEEDRYDFVQDILIRYKNMKADLCLQDGVLLEQYRLRGGLLQDQHGFPETGGSELFLQYLSGYLFQGR